MDHSVDLSGSLVCERERERNWNMLEIKNENDPTKCAILDKEKIKEKLGTTQLKKLVDGHSGSGWDRGQVRRNPVKLGTTHIN